MIQGFTSSYCKAECDLKNAPNINSSDVLYVVIHNDIIDDDGCLFGEHDYEFFDNNGYNFDAWRTEEQANSGYSMILPKTKWSVHPILKARLTNVKAGFVKDGHHTVCMKTGDKVCDSK